MIRPIHSLLVNTRWLKVSEGHQPQAPSIVKMQNASHTNWRPRLLATMMHPKHKIPCLTLFNFCFKIKLWLSFAGSLHFKVQLKRGRALWQQFAFYKARIASYSKRKPVRPTKTFYGIGLTRRRLNRSFFKA